MKTNRIFFFLFSTTVARPNLITRRLHSSTGSISTKTNQIEEDKNIVQQKPNDDSCLSELSL
jgi:hypothetical protein